MCRGHVFGGRVCIGHVLGGRVLRGPCVAMVLVT